MNLIETYNPANASKLTPEQIDAMQDFTDEQLAQLAKAYPNQPTGNVYLMYFDTSEKGEQRYPRGTFENLVNLRKLGKKELVAAGFVKGHIQPIATTTKGPVTTKKTVDLGEAEKLEGIKKADAPLPAVSEKVAAAQAALQKAVDEKAHHMTIKQLQKALDEAIAEEASK